MSQAPIRSKEMQPAVNGWGHCVGCDAFVTIRAGDVAVTTIRPDGTRERPRTFFGPYSLQSTSKPSISEAPVRSNDWAALTLLVRNLALTGLVPFTGD